MKQDWVGIPIVNQNIKRVGEKEYWGFKKMKRQPKLQPFERRIFEFIGSDKFRKKEFGGYMDFGKDNKLEKFRTNIGGYNYVDVDADYEVIYHTHPTQKGVLSPPSVDDIMASITSSKQQAQIIFNNVVTYVIIVTPKSRSIYSKLGEQKYEQELNKTSSMLYSKHKTMALYETAWLNALRTKYGFKIIRDTKHTKQLNIPITPVEGIKPLRFKMM